MKIYNYDGVTKEFTTESKARVNPLVPGEFLIPSNSTPKKPSRALNGKVNVFNVEQDEWFQSEDNRGEVYDKVTKLKVNHVDLGELPSGLTRLNPPVDHKWQGSKWVVDLELKKSNKLQEIKLNAEQSLVPLTCLGVKWVPGIESTFRLDGVKRLAMLAGDLKVTFFDINDNPHDLSFTEADEVIKKVGLDYQVKFTKKKKLMRDIKVASVGNIDSIEW